MLVSDVTVLIPFKRGGNEDWLRQAKGSLPVGTNALILENDSELAEALNEGLKQADTEYVLRLDADDVLAPRALEFLREMIWNVDVTYPSQVLCFEDLKPFENQKAAAFCSNRLLVFNYISGCALMRREAVLSVGGYRDLEMLEDWDLYVRLMRAGYQFKAVQEARLLYRQHPGSRNRVSADKVQETQERLRREIVGEPPSLKASWYYQASYPTTYWRCLVPSRQLPGAAFDYPAVQRLGDEEAPEIHFPDQQGASIWQFPGSLDRAILMSEMQDRGHPVFIEIDDNYLTQAPFQKYTGWTKKVSQNPGKTSLEGHKRILSFSDGIICSTEALAKKYRKLHTNVYVCPNSVDPADWAEPEKLDDGIFRLGWFASPSHLDDLKLVSRALAWAGEQKDVQVCIMGLLRLGRNGEAVLPRLLKETTFRHYPWSNDMGVYRKLLGTLDVGLAPIIETPWSVCRSDVKALEYGMAGVAPVLSDVAPYETYKGPCIKARTAKDFLYAVQHLVHNRDEVKQMAQEARTYVFTERQIGHWIHTWEEAIGSCNR